MRKISGQVRRMLTATVRANRRRTIYKMLLKKFGFVPCWVCGCHVPREQATLEHIVPLSRGGMDEMSNLSISHWCCNQEKGNEIVNKKSRRWNAGSITNRRE